MTVLMFATLPRYLGTSRDPIDTWRYFATLGAYGLGTFAIHLLRVIWANGLIWINLVPLCVILAGCAFLMVKGSRVTETRSVP